MTAGNDTSTNTTTVESDLLDLMSDVVSDARIVANNGRGIARLRRSLAELEKWERENLPYVEVLDD